MTGDASSMDRDGVQEQGLPADNSPHAAAVVVPRGWKERFIDKLGLVAILVVLIPVACTMHRFYPHHAEYFHWGGANGLLLVQGIFLIFLMCPAGFAGASLAAFIRRRGCQGVSTAPSRDSAQPSESSADSLSPVPLIVKLACVVVFSVYVVALSVFGWCAYDESAVLGDVEAALTGKHMVVVNDEYGVSIWFPFSSLIDPPSDSRRRRVYLDGSSKVDFVWGEAHPGFWVVRYQSLPSHANRILADAGLGFLDAGVFTTTDIRDLVTRGMLINLDNSRRHAELDVIERRRQELLSVVRP